MTGGKREKSLGLEMDFAEALARFAGVDPGELPDRIKLGKKPRPKRDGDPEEPPPKIPPKRKISP